MMRLTGTSAPQGEEDVRAEIKTGQRRMLDYLLSPLARHLQEALRER